MNLQQLEREFREYMEARVLRAKQDFRELLKETKIITHKSKAQVADNEQHLKDILAVLEVPRTFYLRFLAL